MKRLGFPTAFALCLFFTGACDSGNKPDTNPPGEGCPEQGAQKKADDGCNTCICTVDGWSCSEMACEDPDAAAEEGGGEAGEDQPVDAEAEGGATDRATAEACTPGETKQEDCNECSCGDEGVWTCTAMACETEESPKT